MLHTHKVGYQLTRAACAVQLARGAVDKRDWPLVHCPGALYTGCELEGLWCRVQCPHVQQQGLGSSATGAARSSSGRCFQGKRLVPTLVARVSHPVLSLGRDGSLQLSRIGRFSILWLPDGALLTLLLLDNKAAVCHALCSIMYQSCCASVMLASLGHCWACLNSWGIAACMH